MSRQYEILSCPFCHERTIEAVYFPGAWSEKRSGKNSLGRGVSVSKSLDQWSIMSGCSKCGKTQEEVEKKLRNEGFV